MIAPTIADRVRRIVLDVIGADPEAARAYMLEPAMRHGVEVTVGVLGRAAAILNTTAGYSRLQTEALIREIAVACSRSGGPENETAIATANGQLHPLADRAAADAEELHDLRALFDLQHTRMVEATALWRAEDPATRDRVLPDLGTLLQWLIDRGNAAGEGR